MSFFKELIGYDLHTSRMVFNHDGVEVVFIHDFFLLKRRIYIDGELIFNRHSPWLGFITDTEFEYKGRAFRIVTRVLNFLTLKQDVTVWVDGTQIGRKIDPFYVALSTPKKLHAILGLIGFGLVVGVMASSLSSVINKLAETVSGI